MPQTSALSSMSATFASKAYASLGADEVRKRALKTAQDFESVYIADAFKVSWETAAHRVTNLATRHLGFPLHCAKEHETGTVYKAYENDGIVFPMDPTGAIEGQPVCRQWASRQVFERGVAEGEALHQFTDTPAGTYWDSVRVERTAGGRYSIALGTDFVNAKWFRGRDTRVRTRSTCPDEACCRRPPTDLLAAWGGQVWPSARARTHMMAALPPGSTSITSAPDRARPCRPSSIPSMTKPISIAQIAPQKRCRMRV